MKERVEVVEGCGGGKGVWRGCEGCGSSRVYHFMSLSCPNNFFFLSLSLSFSYFKNSTKLLQKVVDDLTNLMLR